MSQLGVFSIDFESRATLLLRSRSCLEIHYVGPVFEGDDSEEGEEGVAEMAKMHRIICSEEENARYTIDAKQEE